MKTSNRNELPPLYSFWWYQGKLFRVVGYYLHYASNRRGVLLLPFRSDGLHQYSEFVDDFFESAIRFYSEDEMKRN